MMWPFSLPPSLPKDSHYLRGYGVERATAEFKHVVLVNHERWWADRLEFELWCQRNFCYYMVDRVHWDQWMRRWTGNGISGTDELFICTNCDRGVLMATLKWG